MLSSNTFSVISIASPGAFLCPPSRVRPKNPEPRPLGLQVQRHASAATGNRGDKASIPVPRDTNTKGRACWERAHGHRSRLQVAQYTSCAAVAKKAALGELAHEDDHAKLGLSSCGVPPRDM